jgi:hypothetical protein
MVYPLSQYPTVRLGLLPVLVLLLVYPSLAIAQPEPSSSWATEDASAKAKKLMAEGNALYAKRDFDGAHQKFLEAWTIKQHNAIASNLVETEMKLGRYGEAASRLRSLLSSMPMDDKEERTAFMMQLSECRHHLVALHITVSEDGATVKVDDKEVGKSPLDNEVLVDPGQSSVTAELDGYQSATESTGAAAAGESKSISLALVKTVAPQPVEIAPIPAISTSTPTVIEHPHGGIKARTIVLVGGTTLAVVGVGLGVVYWRLRANTDSDARGLQANLDAGARQANVSSSSACRVGPEVGSTQCAKLQDDASRYDSQTRLMAGMFIGGGIAAASTVVTYLVWPSGGSRNASSVPVKASFQPWSSPNSAGFNVVGQF